MTAKVDRVELANKRFEQLRRDFLNEEASESATRIFEWVCELADDMEDKLRTAREDGVGNALEGAVDATCHYCKHGRALIRGGHEVEDEITGWAPCSATAIRELLAATTPAGERSPAVVSTPDGDHLNAEDQQFVSDELQDAYERGAREALLSLGLDLVDSPDLTRLDIVSFIADRVIELRLRGESPEPANEPTTENGPDAD